MDKPSDNFTLEMLKGKGSSIKQKAMQTWLLAQAFPFLFYDKVDELDDVLVQQVKDLFSYHLEILKTVLSFEVTIEQVI